MTTAKTLAVRALCAAGVLLTAACDDSSEPASQPVALDIEQYPFPVLSDYNFFVGELDELDPNEGVIPYTVNAPLWADGADKGRFFVLPEGGKITWTEKDEWLFPAGSVFIKNFYFDQDRGPAEDLRIIETRLLVLNASGDWDSHIYMWDEEQTEAEHIKAGADIFVDYIDENGVPGEQLYLVPDQNTCESCHQRDDTKLILGPTTHQLNTQWEIQGEQVNQIDYLREQDLFANAVPPASDLPAYPNPAGDASLDERARAYLHGNCAHCHRPGGDGGSSGLKFTYDVTDQAEFGACKLPAAAGPGAGGRRYDIFPGSPEQSIVPFRMASEDPEIKMPELPSLLSDQFGVDLITEWITAMEPWDCTAIGG
jgi:uncharacterized repeat protein (TIGR03806 family)